MKFIPKRKYFYFYIILCALSSCSWATINSYQAIHEKYFQVDLTDGVNQDEAAVLAQYFIVTKGLGDRLFSLIPIKVIKKNIWYKDGQALEIVDPPSPTFEFPLEKSWEVQFRDKKGSFFHGLYPIMPFYIDVDVDTGEIRRWGLKK